MIIRIISRCRELGESSTLTLRWLVVIGQKISSCTAVYMSSAWQLFVVLKFLSCFSDFPPYLCGTAILLPFLLDLGGDCSTEMHTLCLVLCWLATGHMTACRASVSWPTSRQKGKRLSSEWRKWKKMRSHCLVCVWQDGREVLFLCWVILLIRGATLELADRSYGISCCWFCWESA